ncbi:unnamed protein product [Gadus morhua 'NCC']
MDFYNFDRSADEKTLWRLPVVKGSYWLQWDRNVNTDFPVWPCQSAQAGSGSTVQTTSQVQLVAAVHPFVSNRRNLTSPLHRLLDCTLGWTTIELGLGSVAGGRVCLGLRRPNKTQ